MIPLVSLFSLLSSLASVTPARAEDKAAARDHWDKGTKFYDLGKYDEAIREFESAYEAKGDPAFLYNLAQSHRLAGHPNDSLRFYRTYLRYVPKPPNRADIEERIKELEKIVAERPAGDSAPTAPPIVPSAPSSQTNSQPQVGSPVTPSIPSPQVAPPGTWPSPVGAGSPSTAPANGAEVQPVPPVEMSPAGPPSPPPAVGSGSGRRTISIALAAAGGGLVVVGAIFGLVTKNQSDKVERATTFDPAAQRLGKTAQTLQWVGYVAGGAALVTGLILYATAPSTSSYETPAARVAVAPLLGPGAGGALLRLTF